MAKKKEVLQSNEFPYSVVESLVHENNIEVTEAVEITKKFLITTIKNFLGLRKAEDVKNIIIEEGEKMFSIYLKYEVVTLDNYTDEKTQILISEAMKIDPTIKESDLPEYVDGIVKEGLIPVYIKQPFPYNDIITSKALSAGKSGFIKDIKEYKYKRIYEEFKEREGEFVTGIVELSNNNFTLLKIKDTEGVIKPEDQIKGEVYSQGDIVKAIIKEVKQAPKSKNDEYQIELSRTDETFIRRLFENEVPEIAQGVIEIKAVSRIAGERTKIAVFSKDNNVDPIGACIGPKGIRIHAIMQEIVKYVPTGLAKVEKIDVFEWNDNISELVKNVFSPANVVGCMYSSKEINPSLKDEDFIKGERFNSKPLCVVVAENQKSLAIGGTGMNVKLAASLIKAKNIDIREVKDLEELGIDYVEESRKFFEDQDRIIKEKRQQEFLKASLKAMEQAQNSEDVYEEDETYYGIDISEEKDFLEIKKEEKKFKEEVIKAVKKEEKEKAIKEENAKKFPTKTTPIIEEDYSQEELYGYEGEEIEELEETWDELDEDDLESYDHYYDEKD